MFGIIIGIGFFGMITFIFTYQLCLTLRRLNQAVVIPLALLITALFVLAALERVLTRPEALAIFHSS